MKQAVIAALASAMLSFPVLAQTPAPTAPPPAAVTPLPAQSMPISDWYGQAVYDRNNSKIGDVSDIMIDPQGQATIAIVGVGGFLGIGEKNVGVPFKSITRNMRDGKPYLTMDANKESLTSAAGLRYDRTTSMWMPDTAPSTTSPNPSVPRTNQ